MDWRPCNYITGFILIRDHFCPVQRLSNFMYNVTHQFNSDRGKNGMPDCPHFCAIVRFNIAFAQTGRPCFRF